MSGALSSIFQGSPVPPQPTQSDTSTSYPQWMQQYDYNLANAATNLAGQPYTPVPFPQVAQPSAATQQSWQMAQNNVGNWQPNLNQAGALASAGAAPITSSQINQYLNPYTNNVISGLQNASNYNLMTNQMPAIQSQFVSAGQAASPQQMQSANNALYLSNQALDQATANALQSGYQGALNTATQEQGYQLQGAGVLGQLGALQGQLGALDVGQVAAAGQGQDTYNQSNINAALNNFYAQQQWPYQNLAYASNVVRGQNIPSNTQTVGTAYYPGQSYAPSPLSSFVGTTLGSSSLLNGSQNNSGSSSSNSNNTTGSVFGSRGGHLRRGALSLAA